MLWEHAYVIVRTHQEIGCSRIKKQIEFISKLFSTGDSKDPLADLGIREYMVPEMIRLC